MTHIRKEGLDISYQEQGIFTEQYRLIYSKPRTNNNV